MREFLFPLILSVFAIVGGVFIALSPVMDPTFVHPVALASSGIFFAVFGAAVAVWAIMAGLLERRQAEMAAAIDYRLSR